MEVRHLLMAVDAGVGDQAVAAAVDASNLRHLADRLLGDMGISRDAAAREASKPFWKV